VLRPSEISESNFRNFGSHKNDPWSYIEG